MGSCEGFQSEIFYVTNIVGGWGWELEMYSTNKLFFKKYNIVNYETFNLLIGRLK
jgi:hypothetical protein